MIKRGFSLLETLIATGILVIVVLAIVALSNSLIAGTILGADKTIINRWAAEGIELTTKVRDDNILNKSTAQTTNWFEPAISANGSSYGWYILKQDSTHTTWKMTSVADGGSINKIQFMQLGEKLTSDQIIGYRLICVEAVSASADASNNDANPFHCNTQGSTTLQDGLRTVLSDCQVGQPDQPNDLYCQMTKASVNKNHLDLTRIIPAGSAVKIRSVVVWEERDQVHSSSLTSLITNWKGYEQSEAAATN